MGRRERRKAKAIGNLQNYVHPEALQKLTDEVDRTASSSDRQYFIDYPQRQFRLRPAWPAETAIDEILAGPDPCRKHHYVLVKQIARGVRMRALLRAPNAAQFDCPDDKSCSALWDCCCDAPDGSTDKIAEVERVLRSFTPKES
jgi:hypothetical protein